MGLGIIVIRFKAFIDGHRECRRALAHAAYSVSSNASISLEQGRRSRAMFSCLCISFT
jgi:hypothetical protein